jgi:hypothetical protein
MSPLVDNYQCLACGGLTAMDTHQVVVPQVEGPNLSNLGLPVKELGEVAPVVLAPVVPESPPEADSEPYELDEVEPDGIMGRDVDISTLTPEQIATLKWELGIGV